MSTGYLHTKENKELCLRLIAARKEAGLTQAELASRLGKLQSYVTKYEREERRIDVIEFIMIARALGLPPEKLFTEVVSLVGQ